MRIRQAEEGGLDAWVALRCALWPESSEDALRREARSVLRSADQVCFLLTQPGGSPAGFVEAAIHSGPEGPYGHVEAWYVMPECRRKGHGRALIGAVEQWCLHRTICRLTSDTTPDYPLSPAAHARAGFRKIHELTIFMKELEPPAASGGEGAVAEPERSAQAKEWQ